MCAWGRGRTVRAIRETGMGSDINIYQEGWEQRATQQLLGGRGRG